ncbi:MAG: amidohydrolase family protein [Bacteroidales bacterium]
MKLKIPGLIVKKMKQYLRFILAIVLIANASDTFSQSVSDMKLKDFRPKSIYKTPVSQIKKAKYPVIDMHSHPYATSDAEIAQWVKTMDAKGIQKTIILTMATGAKFDSLYAAYAKYGDRFELWCGFDYTGYDKPGFGPAAVKELERCYKIGARGIGELGDKGIGEFYSEPVPGIGLHLDDARMKPLLEKCAELGMPINVHIAEPIWMYETMDSTNDGLMNAFEWKIDKTQKNLLGFDALIQTLENAVRDNPKTTFIACHYANCNHDLEKLGILLNKYPNLYADVAARFAEASVVPRYTLAFHKKYQDRLVYGTDNGMDPEMYEITFRIFESLDEHFYAEMFGYHWAYNGLGIPDKILKKLYLTNAQKILSGKK